jgi:Na+-driven multidrug efflux pump
MDVTGGQLRGMGKSFLPMIVTLLGACGLRILWIFTLYPTNPTLEFLYWAYPVSWGITFLVLFVCYFIVRKQIMKEIGNRN